MDKNLRRSRTSTPDISAVEPTVYPTDRQRITGGAIDAPPPSQPWWAKRGVVLLGAILLSWALVIMMAALVCLAARSFTAAITASGW